MIRSFTGLSLGILFLLGCGGIASPNWKTTQPSSHPLIEATKSGDSDAVARWLATGVDVNRVDNAGIDALGHAAKAGATVIGGLLLSGGAQVNRASGGFSAIMRAAFYGHDDFVALLLKHNADMDQEAANGYAAFDWALEGGHKEVMKVLLAWRLRRDHPATQACLQAIENDDEKALNQHLKHTGALPDPAASLLYSFAALDEDRKAIGTLVDAALPLNVHNPTGYAPLPLACRLDNRPLAKFLLEHGANPNIGNDGNDEASPFLQAARGGNLAMGKLLLEYGADVHKTNARGFSALILAAMYGRTEFTTMLLERGADPGIRQRDGYSAIDYALERGADDVVKLLLTHRARMNATTQETQAILIAITAAGTGTLEGLGTFHDFSKLPDKGVHLLNLAVCMDQPGALTILLDHGASPNAAHDSGYGPLAMAAYFGRLEMLETLLAHDAIVDQASQSRYRTTPLMETTRKGHLEVAQRLLAAGAKVNLGDRHGDHALNWATSYGHLPLVRLFLKAGADPTRTGQEPITALEIARRIGAKAIESLLLSAEANQAETPSQKSN